MLKTGTLVIARAETLDPRHRRGYTIVFSPDGRRRPDLPAHHCDGDEALLKSLEDLVGAAEPRRQLLEGLRDDGEAALEVLLSEEQIQRYGLATASAAVD
jgi:hypothetical protein